MRSIRPFFYALALFSSFLVAGESRPGARAGSAAAPDTTLPPPDSILYVRYIQTFPDRPNSGQATIVAVVGDFPFPCGEVFLANARDSAHLVISIRPRATCADTTPGGTWYEAFLLGFLPPGLHHTDLALTVVEDPAAPPGTDPVVYRGAFEFIVHGPTTPSVRRTWAELKRRYR